VRVWLVEFVFFTELHEIVHNAITNLNKPFALQIKSLVCQHLHITQAGASTQASARGAHTLLFCWKEFPHSCERLVSPTNNTQTCMEAFINNQDKNVKEPSAKNIANNHD
jgi:hypothetical protein